MTELPRERLALAMSAVAAMEYMMDITKNMSQKGRPLVKSCLLFRTPDLRWQNFKQNYA